MTVYGLARSTGGSRMTIVLAGVALTSLLSAGSDALVTLWPEAVMDRSSFSIGGFGGVAVPSVGGRAALFCWRGWRGRAAFGAAERSFAGRRGGRLAGGACEAVPLCALLCAALLAACAVSMGGLISFVGLLVPHALRFTVGSDYRWLTLFGPGRRDVPADVRYLFPHAVRPV